MGKAQQKKIKVPKKIPAWMEVLFVYLAERDKAPKRTYKPIMTLVSKRWDDFVRDRSAPPAPRKKKEPEPAENEAAATAVGDEGDEEENTDPIEMVGQEPLDGMDQDGAEQDDGQGSPLQVVDPAEQARADQAARDQFKSVPETLRKSLREAYGPPRTPTKSDSKPMGAGWRHAHQQAEDLYVSFRKQAASVGVGDGHPLVEPVSCLYSLAKEAINARQQASMVA